MNVVIITFLNVQHLKLNLNIGKLSFECITVMPIPERTFYFFNHPLFICFCFDAFSMITNLHLTNADVYCFIFVTISMAVFLLQSQAFLWSANTDRNVLLFYLFKMFLLTFLPHS